MADTLKQYLKDHIAQHGPIDVGQFMSIALGHPKFGYYMKQDPLGSEGDFTTAPEISQMFGEVIGAWAADVWMQLGQPESLTVLECGPGRGTLMADMMRAGKNIEGFHKVVSIHLLETSPALKEKQRQALAGFDVAWHDTLETVPRGAPVIVIANEFLDALPVRQFEKTGDGWMERVVTNANDNFAFGLAGHGLDIPPSVEGDVFEISPARESFVRNTADMLKTCGGAALFIDYGHVKTGAGDTFQALRKHQYTDVFDHIGDADLTSHVDFAALKAAAEKEGAQSYGPVEQGAFLMALGIVQRAEALYVNAGPEQKQDIENALQRLIASDQMGTLFKVFGMSHGSEITPAGF